MMRVFTILVDLASGENSYSDFHTDDFILSAFVVKQHVREAKGLLIPNSGLILIQQVHGDAIELSDDAIVRVSGSGIHLVMIVLKPHVKYTIISPNGETNQSSIFSPEDELNHAEVSQLIHRCQKITGIMSFDVSGCNVVPKTHIFRREAIPIFVRLQKILKHGLTWKAVLVEFAELLGQYEWKVLEKFTFSCGFLRLNIPQFRESTFTKNWTLWSTEIIEDIRQVVPSIMIPVDQVRRYNDMEADVVMVGVSGCGKSRTCFDFCRGRFCVYLDWANHRDLQAFTSSLPILQTRRDQDIVRAFEKEIKIASMRLLLSRLMIIKQRSGKSPDDIFQLQHFFCVRDVGLFECVSQLSDKSLIDEFNHLAEWARQQGIVVVSDESHVLLGVLSGQFHSVTSGAINDQGQYEKPRSFLSFFVKFLKDYGLRSVWAGTHLRLGDIALFNSARLGYGPSKPYLLTDFNYLSHDMIYKLLGKWVVINCVALKKRISYELQGRPRFFMTFLTALSRWDGYVSDSSLERIYKAVLGDLICQCVEFWKRSCNKHIQVFDPPDSEFEINRGGRKYPVASLLEDLLCNDCLTDIGRREYAHWYRSLVSTSLVMLAKVDKEEGLLCEPIVIKAGRDYGKIELGRDFPFETILNRDIVMKNDGATRGKAVEALCVVRLRECFWTKCEFFDYFPDRLREIIETGGGIATPIGIHDCRSGVKDHAVKLRASFLNRDATHIVLSQEAGSAADVVYSFFTFHIKTTWFSVNDRPLVIGNASSNANAATIRNTWHGDEAMTQRVQLHPWLCVRFEFPTNAEMRARGVAEIIQREPLKTTIIASIDATFTRLFFGEHFVSAVKRLIS